MTRRLRTFGTLALTAASAGVLGACVNLESFSMGELPVAPGSPVELAAREAARNPGPFPTFAGIPRLVETPPNPQLAQESRSSLAVQARAILQIASQGDTLTEAEIEALHAQAAAVSAQAGAAPTQADIAEIDALMRQLRARATPPPPPS